MTTVPATDALAADAFDYAEEKAAPARTTQDQMAVVIKTREILITKQTPGYLMYSRIAKIMFLVSFLCLLAVIVGTVWFAYELVNSANVLHEIQSNAAATAATR